MMAQRKDQSSSKPLEIKQEAKTSSPSQAQNIIIGCGIAAILLAIITAVIFFFIWRNRPYTLNKDLSVPSIDELPEYTNKDKIDVTGRAKEDARIALFIDGEDSGKKVTARGNGKYEFEDIFLDDEKTYKFKVAQVSIGLTKKERSKFSKERAVIVDRKSPGKSVELEETPKKTGAKKITIKGSTDEKATEAIAKKGSKEYTGEIDKEGKFVIKDVELNEGENKFRIILKDQAGNETDTGALVIVTMDPDLAPTEGDLNGEGAATGGETLPDSAGEIEAVISWVQGNSLLMMITVVSIAMFGLLNMKGVLKEKSR